MARVTVTILGGAAGGRHHAFLTDLDGPAAEVDTFHGRHAEVEMAIRCEVLGLRLEDLRIGQRQVFIAEGKGGRQRAIPVVSLLRHRRRLSPRRASGARRHRQGLPGDEETEPRRRLSAAGLDQILQSARDRTGLTHASCHELRHTCLTRLREAGMALVTRWRP